MIGPIGRNIGGPVRPEDDVQPWQVAPYGERGARVVGAAKVAREFDHAVDLPLTRRDDDLVTTTRSPDDVVAAMHAAGFCAEKQGEG